MTGGLYQEELPVRALGIRRRRTAAEEMGAGETTGIECLPELVLRWERAASCCGLMRWKLRILNGGGRAVAGRSREKTVERRKKKNAEG